ncbi:hypothetical protein FHX42_001090 [Saccharopolyspora lacisalsi]|uniref:Uncharacterized protein n=1 Tax=Halosaccharopolyspora lacisalsi TaxID=1000566 RepID=A0A839DX30_9PSEU|nr:hypothetical protein [Halosaccharopolyspora lacisalsi]MBA8823761.1 hypothetical protein [Halosaccharopolyspora lacisalsi]
MRKDDEGTRSSGESVPESDSAADAHREQFGVATLCRGVDFSVSTYYTSEDRDESVESGTARCVRAFPARLLAGR